MTARTSIWVVLALCSAGCPGPAAGRDAGASDGGPAKGCPVAFSYRPGSSANRVSVTGEWNQFDRSAQAMTDSDGNGSYELELNVPPGEWAYFFSENGAEKLDAMVKHVRYISGRPYPAVRVADCRAPRLTVQRETMSQSRSAAGAGTFQVTLSLQAPNGSPILEGSLHSSSEDFDVAPRRLSAAELTSEGATATIKLKSLADGKYTLRVRVSSGDAASEWLLLPFWVEQETFSFIDSPLYMVVTDRFRNGNTSNDFANDPVVPRSAQFQGGDFDGIEQAIREGYFDALHVKAVWLTPWQTQPAGHYPSDDGHEVTGYHGYWPVKAREIEPRFGGAPGLKRLVTEAHRHGIRIMMDTVLNHVHAEHEYFRDPAKKAWFRTECVCGTSTACGWDTARLTCLFAPYMPDINWTNNDASAQFIADTVWMIEEFDLDGLRLDATKHMEEAAITNLTAAVRERFEQTGTKHYMFGENFTNDASFIKQVIGPNALDGQLNFPLFLGDNGRGGPEATFARDDFGLTEIRDRTQSMADVFAGAMMVTFIGSHDVPRFITKADPSNRDQQGSKWQRLPAAPSLQLAYDRLFMAMTHLMTSPGVPLIYYGDEYGEFGGQDPDNRHMLTAAANLNGQQKEQAARMRSLLTARAQLRGLRRGSLKQLWSNHDQWGNGSGSLMAYARADADPKQSAVVVLNLTGALWPGVSVDAREALSWSGGTVVDALSGRAYSLNNGSMLVDVPARGAAILHLQ